MDDFFIFDITPHDEFPTSLETADFDPEMVSKVSALLDAYPGAAVIKVTNGLIEQRLLRSPAFPLSLPGKVRGCALPNNPGVYAIYRSRQIVYVGSTRNLRQRLNKHATKVAYSSIPLDECSVRYTNACGAYGRLSLELQMISHYKPEWNSLGFGSNDPGSGRKDQARSRWDELYCGAPA